MSVLLFNVSTPGSSAPIRLQKLHLPSHIHTHTGFFQQTHLTYALVCDFCLINKLYYCILNALPIASSQDMSQIVAW